MIFVEYPKEADGNKSRAEIFSDMMKETESALIKASIKQQRILSNNKFTVPVTYADGDFIHMASFHMYGLHGQDVMAVIELDGGDIRIVETDKIKFIKESSNGI